MRDALVLLLSLHQYVVRVAEDRGAALESLEFGPPDIILLMDWIMPGMPLEAFLTTLRQKHF